MRESANLYFSLRWNGFLSVIRTHSIQNGGNESPNGEDDGRMVVPEREQGVRRDLQFPVRLQNGGDRYASALIET